LEADLTFTKSSSSEPQWMGGGQAVNVQISSKTTQGRVYLDAIPFTVASVMAVPGKRSKDHIVAVPPHIEVGPINVELPKAGLTSIKGAVDSRGYSFQLQGETDIPHLIRAAKTAGLSVPPIVAEGQAATDISVAGKWAGFAPALVSGKLQFHAVRAQVRGLARPLDIPSVTLLLEPDEARAQNLTAQFAGSLWRGNVTLRRQCSASEVCP